MFKFKSDEGVEATWNGGMIDAPSEVMATLAEVPAEVCLPPVGPCLPFSLGDPAAVLILFIMVLGPGVVVLGDEPEIADSEIPEGAIA
jgi:hypothetical protein